MLQDKNQKKTKVEFEVHPVIAFLSSKWIFEDELRLFLRCCENIMTRHRNQGLQYGQIGRQYIYHVDHIDSYLMSLVNDGGEQEEE